MHQVSLYKNLRSKEDSDKRRKGKLSFMGCHIKIGQLELWAITLGVCGCDPSLGAARPLAVEPTCVSTLRQLETAAFPQLITTSLSSASSKRNTDNTTYPWHCLHTRERGADPPQSSKPLSLFHQSEFTWTLASLILEPTTTQLALPPLQSFQAPCGSYPVFRYYLHLSRFVYLGPGTAYAGPQLGGQKQINFCFWGCQPSQSSLLAYCMCDSDFWTIMLLKLTL